MPAYSFRCESCGEFEIARAMSEASAPMDCPSCGAAARRVFSAPSLWRSSPASREARSREERSRHEPAHARHPTGAPLPHAHGDAGQRWAVSH